ncbi:unnamed protein product [Lupinus luteus]|uniref:Uncharacterized protein n=1 Tax=Lupinus luteus TaxID=3873 RepID=A0AAV1WNB2_LUPLU
MAEFLGGKMIPSPKILGDFNDVILVGPLEFNSKVMESNLVFIPRSFSTAQHVSLGGPSFNSDPRGHALATPNPFNRRDVGLVEDSPKGNGKVKGKGLPLQIMKQPP